MSDSVDHRQRGQSELIGIVLLFALVITVSLTVVVVGGSALSDLQSDTMKESAEVSMVELQSKAALAGSSGASVQEVSFVKSEGARPNNARAAGVGSKAENAGAISVGENAGEMRIKVQHSTGTLSETVTMGTITYQREQETIAYQGGGVFRKNTQADGSTMISPPNFQYQYRNGVPTLSMPVTSVKGVASDEFSLTQVSSKRIFPAHSAANPIKSGNTVTITVESEFYQAWANLFRQRTDGTVTTSDFNGNGKKAARLELSGPPSTAPISNSAVSSSLQPQLNGPNQARIDSYDSGSQTYSRSKGPLIVRGDFMQSNHFELDGPLYVSGRAYLDIQAHSGTAGYVKKDVNIHGDPTNAKDSRILGKTQVHGDVQTTDTLFLEGRGPGVSIKGDVFVGADGTSTSITKFRETTVEGSVHVQGNMPRAGSDAEIQGDLYVEGSVDESQWRPHVDGTIHEGTDVATPADPDPLPPISNVDSKIDTFEDNNNDPSEHDNSDHTMAVSQIQSGSCGTGGAACTLTSSSGGSNYYLPGGMDVDSGTVVLDTTNGPINIYAGPGANGDNGIYLDGGTIKVKGSYGVKVYTDGKLNFETGKITTAPKAHRAENFRVYMRTTDHSGNKNKMSFKGNNGNPSTYTGVFMSPDASDGGKVLIDSHAEVYGSIMGEVTNIAQQATIHFDEALLNPSVAGPAGGGPDSVAYLQLTKRVLKID